MGMKPRTKPEKRQATYEEMKDMVESLGSCVLWALKFMKTSSGAGMVFHPETGVIEPWQEKFMNALDKTGYVIDREAYYAGKSKPKSRKRQM